jgi:hypothetical protein
MFRKIGQYEIGAMGEDVLRVWSSDECNLESAQEYAAAVAQMIERMPPRFGVLACLEAPLVLGPEVEASMTETARQRARRGMVAVAFVIERDDGLSIADRQWTRIYRPSGVAHAFFADEREAAAWLRARIDAAGPAA